MSLIESFQETLCDNMEIVEANIRSVKISSPDVSSERSLKTGVLKRPGSTRDGTPIKLLQTTGHESKIMRNITKQLKKQHGHSFAYRM